MLTYRVAYRLQLGCFFAEVFDFPEATAFGTTVAEARANLLSALRYAAEQRLKRGQLLPVPDPRRVAGDAYLLESVTVLPADEARVTVHASGG
jgi:predicted RNase H-like HicB family nuclease